MILYLETQDKRKKTRDIPESPPRQQKQTKLNNYWLSKPMSTNNRFSLFSEENKQNKNSEMIEKLTKSSPLYSLIKSAIYNLL